MIIADSPRHVAGRLRYDHRSDLYWPMLEEPRIRKLLIAAAAWLVAWPLSGVANAQSVYEPGITGYPGQPATPKPGELVVNMGMGVTTYVNGSWKTGQTHGSGTGSKQQPTVITGYGRSLHR